MPDHVTAMEAKSVTPSKGQTIVTAPGGEVTALTATPRPGPRSGYASSSCPPRRSFGHGPEGLDGLLVARPRQSDEAGRGEPGLLDRHVGMLLEETQQPASGDPLMAMRILTRDQQRELKRVEEAELRELSSRGDSGKHVPALERLLEDPVGPTLGGRRSSSPSGAGRPSPV
jgi:hypothetical protein